VAFLRFSRDKRGYEHFYLVEATTNRRGKTRPRILYWFRTPPGVKVGRQPFDADVRRMLETQNPGVSFDWQKIEATPIPSADVERWRERRRAERAERAARRATETTTAPAPEDDVVDVVPGDVGDGEVDSEELNEAADIAVDAAEQQADALAPTEESLVSAAASLPDAPVPQQQTGSPDVPPDVRARARRRRRRRRGQTHGPRDAQPPQSAPDSAEKPEE
jgi:hypothetical protein